MKDTLSVAELIKVARLGRQMSARQLSAESGLSPSYVGKVEAGEIEPSLRAFGQLARALNLTQHEISACVMAASAPEGEA